MKRRYNYEGRVDIGVIKLIKGNKILSQKKGMLGGEDREWRRA